MHNSLTIENNKIIENYNDPEKISPFLKNT